MKPADLRRAIAAVEYHSQRELAQTVGCPDCKALIGNPCRGRWGDVLPMEHPARIRKAEEFRERGEIECTVCARVELLTPEQRGSTPWPAVEVWCAWHLRVRDEIGEAREMEAR